ARSLDFIGALASVPSRRPHQPAIVPLPVEAAPQLQLRARPKIAIVGFAVVADPRRRRLTLGRRRQDRSEAPPKAFAGGGRAAGGEDPGRPFRRRRATAAGTRADGPLPGR